MTRLKQDPQSTRDSESLSFYHPLPVTFAHVLRHFNFRGQTAHIPLSFIAHASHVLCVTRFKKQRFNQNNFKTTNPHLSWSAESTWWPRKNKSTRKECGCRQQLDTDVRGFARSLQNATLHSCLRYVDIQKDNKRHDFSSYKTMGVWPKYERCSHCSWLLTWVMLHFNHSVCSEENVNQPPPLEIDKIT